MTSLSPTIAPWAEIVPDMGPVTVDFLLLLPDDGYVYEVVDGVLVRMAGSGDEATTIAHYFGVALTNFVQPRRLGLVAAGQAHRRLALRQSGPPQQSPGRWR